MPENWRVAGNCKILFAAGPITSSDWTDTWDGVLIEDEYGDAVGVCFRESKPENNARLARTMAAAPALLEACKLAVTLYEQGCVDRGYKDEINWIDEVRGQLDAAIAAACTDATNAG